MARASRWGPSRDSARYGDSGSWPGLGGGGGGLARMFDCPCSSAGTLIHYLHLLRGVLGICLPHGTSAGVPVGCLLPLC